MALLDKLKSQLSGQPDISTGPSQTGAVRGLLRAKTGKEIAPSAGPRQSALQEKMAERQTQIGAQQLQQKGQIQAEQIGQREADIAQRETQQQEQSQEQFANLQDSMENRTNQILAQFESGEKSLDNLKNLAELEQVGFGLRLQNKQYINQLQSEGEKVRLDDLLEFKSQMAQDILKDQENLMVDKVAFDRVISANDREFSQELANMDIDYAMSMADNSIKQEQARQVASGIGSLVQGGTQAYSAFSSKSKTDNSSGAANTTPLPSDNEVG